MPFEIDGTEYLVASEVVEELGITRQTLWRWRNQGKVPAGRRFRGGQVLFTPAEVRTIREYANRVEPIERTPSGQFRLFNGTP
jgi:predicted DNA-binding transcriptional regulator AlpA